MTTPSVVALWRLAGGGTKGGCDLDRYRELLREHGLLRPGARQPLPCSPVGRDETWTPEECDG